MELLQYKKDMFGQKLLIGVNWDLLWVPVVAAFSLIILHMLIKNIRNKKSTRES